MVGQRDYARKEFGYGLTWVMLFSYPLMAATQAVSARVRDRTRLGPQTGRRDPWPAHG
jgi:Mn2+/Fe2+ NRAMP family transporter